MEKNMNELILIILGCLSLGVGLYIQDWRRKRREDKLSDRLHQAENNIIHLKNLNNERGKK
jgi:type II secretory pathway pseudopilin PulG